MLARHLFALFEGALRGEMLSTESLRGVFIAANTAGLVADLLAQNIEFMAQQIAAETQKNNPHARHLNILVRLYGHAATITVLPALYVGFCTDKGYVGTFFSTPASDSANKLKEMRANTAPLLDNLETIPLPNYMRR